ncbi:ClpX C4-type zinc finger protein [Thermoactinospora rubra]|uniref:ClpX C4-type zinc finger protein n=1 Tax=Thermoactinospora rubra TaxID=1088767 RepID=UPI000A0FAAA5|nr:ClpX C4-type zinc finger protein [Thermoactinospora rubra]
MLDKDSMRCSFCQSKAADVEKLIAGPGVFICDRCVGLCTEILDSERLASSTSQPKLPMWETMSDEEILNHLPNIVAVQRQIEDNLRDWVAHLRSRNISWERIGAALSMSRQSAWERFKTSPPATGAE